MNAIYTYYVAENKRYINEDLKFNYSLLLHSHLLSKKYFKKVILYCDEFTKSYLQGICDFDEYIVFNFENEKVFNSSNFYAIPKLYTYTQQTEPYIHIDHDLFINDPTILYPIIDKDIIIGRFEFNMDFFNINLLDVYETLYGNNLKHVKETNLIDDGIIHDCYLDKIINASIFGGNNYKDISSAYKFVLDLFENNYNLLDGMPFCSLFLEQFLFFPALNHVTGKKYSKEDSFKNYFGVINPDEYKKHTFHLSTNRNDINIKSTLSEMIYTENPELVKKIMNNG
jgi:hypothetical protein